MCTQDNNEHGMLICSNLMPIVQQVWCQSSLTGSPVSILTTPRVLWCKLRTQTFQLPLCGLVRLPAVSSWCNQQAGPSSRCHSAGSSGCWVEPAAGATSAAGGSTLCRCPPDHQADQQHPPHCCRPGRQPDSNGKACDYYPSWLFKCLIWANLRLLIFMWFAENSAKFRLSVDCFNRRSVDLLYLIYWTRLTPLELALKNVPT